MTARAAHYLSHPLPAGADELVLRMRSLGHEPGAALPGETHETTGSVHFICRRCLRVALLTSRGVTGRRATEQQCSGRIT